ncbi:low molecular weight protein-tyrosine-phosphatase [Sphingopyxis sp. GW247-27LB]|uniref:low molecular weight protein-tyrosine-phosphatase n=1 Tax=Sphingopyxis sp. GW247-27LB TaxID=2012632 RepID=UPI000BA77306|nr:low molecular weight protein-tyrosine-phosphatase [Sphingopyxis sp. GW247-27LB]PAL21729.1 phosphotyrosine protein phosphatase [Sphingopyxis sp. GW247-27LB]
MDNDRHDRKDGPAILFLCLGNICRSPLAEGAARAAFDAAGIAATLDSAGTGDWHVGRPPDARAQAEARRRGVDIGTLCARQLVPEDFTRFDLILAADDQNLCDARAIEPPAATARLMLMLDLVPGRAGESVADPYYGDDGGFAATWADVSAVAAALVSAFASSG